MNMKGKIDLYAKIRYEYRWGVGTIRGLAGRSLRSTGDWCGMRWTTLFRRNGKYL